MSSVMMVPPSAIREILTGVTLMLVLWQTPTWGFELLTNMHRLWWE
jgi:hypothetical protein